MNDYWNDPPEEFEVLCPKCGEVGDWVKQEGANHTYKCSDSGCAHEFIWTDHLYEWAEEVNKSDLGVAMTEDIE